MPVLAIQTERRCKLCRHHRREEIDALLEQRSLRHKTDDGQPINQEYVIARLTEWGIENPNVDNIKNHWRKHCRQVTEHEQQQEEERRLDILARIESGEIDLADIDDSIRTLFTIGVEEVKDRVRRGEKSGLTLDHVIKFGDLLTKRRHNEKTEEMMTALGGAVALAFGGKQGELPAGDEIEGEVIEDGEIV